MQISALVPGTLPLAPAAQILPCYCHNTLDIYEYFCIPLDAVSFCDKVSGRVARHSGHIWLGLWLELVLNYIKNYRLCRHSFATEGPRDLWLCDYCFTCLEIEQNLSHKSHVTLDWFIIQQAEGVSQKPEGDLSLSNFRSPAPTGYISAQPSPRHGLYIYTIKHLIVWQANCFVNIFTKSPTPRPIHPSMRRTMNHPYRTLFWQPQVADFITQTQALESEEQNHQRGFQVWPQVLLLMLPKKLPFSCAEGCRRLTLVSLINFTLSRQYL